MSLDALLLVVAGLAGQDALELPLLRHAVEDRVAPGEFRPVLEIHRDGRIGVDGDWLYVPEVDDGKADPLERLRAWLVATAGRMEKEPLYPEKGRGPEIPDDALLIRPDRRTPFRHVRQVLELCCEPEIRIWKIQLAGRTPGGSSGRVATHLPGFYLPWETISWVREVAEVQIHVLEPGHGEDGGPFYSIANFVTQDLESLGRRLAVMHRQRAALGEDPVPFAIDARVGATYEDVAAILDVVLGTGNVEVEFFSFEFPPDLPTVRHAVGDRLVTDEFLPVLEISADGWIGAEGRWLYVPPVDDTKEEPRSRVRSWLAEREGDVLIRAERHASFDRVREVLALCGGRNGTVHLACRTAEGVEGSVVVPLRTERVAPGGSDVEIELALRVREPPVLRPPPATFEDGVLEYHLLGHGTTDLERLGRWLSGVGESTHDGDASPRVTIDPGSGTVLEDVTAVLDVVLAAGLTDIAFRGTR